MTSKEYLFRTALEHSIRVADLIDKYWYKFEPYMKLPGKYTKTLSERDYVYLSGIFHDVGKMTEEYKQEGSGYFHWKISEKDLLKILYPKNVKPPERKALVYVILYVIGNHHEYLGASSAKENYEGLHFIEDRVERLRKIARERTNITFASRNGKLGKPGDLAVYGFAQKALEIVSFFDNLDAMLTRPGKEDKKTKLMNKFLSHPDYYEVYEEVVKK